MKEYTINYKNGKKLPMKAFSVELHDDTFYICTKDPLTGAPEWAFLSTMYIESITEV